MFSSFKKISWLDSSSQCILISWLTKSKFQSGSTRTSWRVKSTYNIFKSPYDKPGNIRPSQSILSKQPYIKYKVQFTMCFSTLLPTMGQALWADLSQPIRISYFEHNTSLLYRIRSTASLILLKVRDAGPFDIGLSRLPKIEICSEGIWSFSFWWMGEDSHVIGIFLRKN